MMTESIELSDEEGEDENSWYRNADYTMEDWAYAVANDDTREDYVRWVIGQHHADGKPIPPKLQAECFTYEQCGLDSDGRAPVPKRFREDLTEEDWKTEVENFDTRVGFETWVLSRVDENPDWREYMDRLAEVSAATDTLEETTPDPASGQARRTPRP